MRDVCIVGGGVSGLAASIYTARAGLDTLIVDGGESILARNASLENYPGFRTASTPVDISNSPANRLETPVSRSNWGG